FAAQNPDETEISVSFNKNEMPKRVGFINKAGKQVKIKSKSVYAIVYRNKAYVASDHHFYPLSKKGNDFYFTGKASDYTAEDMMTAAVFFGLAGALLTQTSNSLFEMKIDHLSGGFIRIREITQ